MIKTKNNFKKRITFWTATIFISLTLSVYFAISAASLGAKLNSLEASQNEMFSLNTNLKSQLITTSSLTGVSELAIKSGMVKPLNLLYLNSPSSVAKR